MALAAPRAMRHLHLAALAPAARLPAWCEALAQTFGRAHCEPLAEPPLEGDATWVEGPALHVARHAGFAQQWERDAAAVAADPIDAYVATLQQRGRGMLEQGGQAWPLEPGALLLWRANLPVRLRLPEAFSAVHWRVPAERLRRLLPQAEARLGPAREPQPALATALAALGEAICAAVPQGNKAPALRLMPPALELIAVALDLAPGPERPTRRLAAFHLARAKALIAERLGDPALSAASVAERAGLSSAHLHRLFQAERTTVGRFILGQRLEACAADLADPRLAGRSIGEIAFARGFVSAAHFSRAFRERFGMSPQGWRRRPRPPSVAPVVR